MTTASTAASRTAARRWRPAIAVAPRLPGRCSLVMLYPLVWLLATSFKPADEIIASLDLLPSHLDAGRTTRRALDGAARRLRLGRFFLNSLLIAGGAVVGNVVSCSLAAYAFARLRFRCRGLLFAFMIATLLLPHHVLLDPAVHAVPASSAWSNTYWPLILPKFLATEAFFVFLMVQFMRGLPRELDEAATIDGCGPSASSGTSSCR